MKARFKKKELKSQLVVVDMDITDDRLSEPYHFTAQASYEDTVAYLCEEYKLTEGRHGLIDDNDVVHFILFYV